MSQVGARLMVASIAKMSRPRSALREGASVFILAMKAATSASDVAGAGGCAGFSAATGTFSARDGEGETGGAAVGLRGVIGGIRMHWFPSKMAGSSADGNIAPE